MKWVTCKEAPICSGIYVGKRKGRYLMLTYATISNRWGIYTENRMPMSIREDLLDGYVWLEECEVTN